MWKPRGDCSSIYSRRVPESFTQLYVMASPMAGKASSDIGYNEDVNEIENQSKEVWESVFLPPTTTFLTS